MEGRTVGLVLPSSFLFFLCILFIKPHFKKSQFRGPKHGVGEVDLVLERRGETWSRECGEHGAQWLVVPRAEVGTGF